MLLASIGAGAMQVAVCDMGRTILARQSHGVSVADGPTVVLGEVMAHFDQLLAEVNARAPTSRASASVCQGRWNSPKVASSVRRS